MSSRSAFKANPETMTPTLDLSIVIVNYKSMDYLRRCLESIYNHEQDVSYEVIVVDNFSQDGSAHFIRAEFPEALLIANSENMGFSYANNQGMKASRGHYILLLNNDTEVLAGALKTFLEVMERNPGIGVVGGRLLNGDRSIQQSYGKVIPFLGDFLQRKLFLNLYEIHKIRWLGKILGWLHSTEKEVDWVKGAGMCLRREAIFAADLMDERYFMYFEEVDLCRRLKRLGWKVYYSPEPQIIHYGGVSVSKNPDQVKFEYRKSQLYFYKKHFGELGLTWIRLYLMLKMAKNYLAWYLKTKWANQPSAELETEGKLIRDVFYLVREYN